ncbi:MAG: hypothetical protein AAGI51_15920 [Pseudomonadota bacterium]
MNLARFAELFKDPWRAFGLVLVFGPALAILELGWLKLGAAQDWARLVAFILFAVGLALTIGGALSAYGVEQEKTRKKRRAADNVFKKARANFANVSDDHRYALEFLVETNRSVFLSPNTGFWDQLVSKGYLRRDRVDKAGPEGGRCGEYMMDPRMRKLVADDRRYQFDPEALERAKRGLGVD